MELLAKPDGTTLADHTQHVRDEVAHVLAARPYLIYKYAVRTGQSLLALVDACARWHDEGKAHSAWQQACRKDFEDSQRTGKVQGLHLLKSGVRHEFASLVKMRKNAGNNWLPASAYAAVAAHHGKLGFRHQKRWADDPTFAPFWHQKFLPLSAELQPDKAADFDQAIARRYEYGGLRALLRLADHRASAQEAHRNTKTPAVPKLGAFRYKFPWAKPTGVQELIPQFWDEPFALLRAPTGAGKTDAALLWAQRQVMTGRADRLVWAMPTRFTANALYISTTETLSSTGIYHSSAWFLAQQREKEQHGRGEYSAAWKQELDYARLFETPTTVTTIDQLCLALTATREDHHATFWNMAHSCVVVDEADFYDDFTQRNLVVLLRALRLLNVPVLLMSATLPASALELYALSGLRAAKIWEDLTNYDRIRFQLHRAGPAELPDDLAPLLERGLNGEPLIIYANTVGRAQAYWDWFQHAKMKHPVVLYHSRFTEPDKKDVEQKLLAMLGPKAWENDVPTGVAILTQIGELSVNISADLMLADLCPTDRLAQRAGRLSRFTKRFDKRGEVVGELHLITPHKTDKKGDKSFYPAPYGHYRQGQGWITSAVLEQAEAQLIPGDYSARRLVDLVNELYPKVVEENTDVWENRRALEDAIVTNWLLLPKAETDQEDEETHRWKSRDIGPQKIVYACTNFSFINIDGDPRVFTNSFAFREWALPHAISISVYDFRRAQQAGKLEEITIHVSQETEVIWTVKTHYYNSLQGLRFDKEPSEADE
ncbi:MAG TPA: CRISPR-associated helicase Cas3' [Hymenobacter sp.]|jgi:CRISPR-associated endonuclease/helicase Cas3|uniref:CRISPR-associated helicase Cas3' n=1 Tax=Hymenobacter sp. TaxID=1898978 RepID=UPI002EDB9C26